MRRRFIADEVSGSRAALTGAHAAHLVRVLRARVGQQFDIAANGRVRLGQIVALAEGRVEFELGEEVPAESIAQLTLLLAVFKFDRMEWAIEKCTELGVARIVPVIAARTDAHLARAAEKRVERWRRIAREAAEQSRRLAPPEIAAPLHLQDNAEKTLAAWAETRIVLHPNCSAEGQPASAISLKEALAAHRSADLALAVGPEGGWTPGELQRFTEAGWTCASVGPTILRAETAVIAAVAIAMSEL